MKVSVNGREFDTDSLEIVTEDGTTLMIDEDGITVVEEGENPSDSYVMPMNELINYTPCESK